MTKKRPWHVRNRAVILSLLASVLISSAFAYYSGLQFESGVMALAHQNNALHNGVDSNVVPSSTGFFSNADSITRNVTVTLKASFGVYITCNDGTTFNGTGPFTCPA
ncbi:MAG: hypothetical protein JRM94_03280 [Nitrososphaerota archaeon]|nr:hypothetical protein [Nitrososphaerota archaeon]